MLPLEIHHIPNGRGLKVAVLGSGVIGLSTGCLLARSGCDVTIYADRLPPSTASDVACAVWCPFFIGDPQYASVENMAALRTWAARSWDLFELLEKSGAGVRWTTNLEMHPSRVDDPFWTKIVKDFSASYDSSLPEGYTYRWAFQTFIVETPVYMMALIDDFIATGGEIVSRRLNSTEDVAALDEHIVFNCTGLGARSLWHDYDVRPVKGQLLLHAPRKLDYTIGAGDFAIIPRTDALVLGTLFETEFSTTEPTEEASNRIWETITPWFRPEHGPFDSRVAQLSRDNVYRIMAGLRPYRSKGIRLEGERLLGKLVVHNYGHGGGGITFSWGCALDAVTLMFNHVG